MESSQVFSDPAISNKGFLEAWQCGLFDMSRIETTYRHRGIVYNFAIILPMYPIRKRIPNTSLFYHYVFCLCFLQLLDRQVMLVITVIAFSAVV